ncbi:MAG: hypothetical protein KDK70_16480 [Myxococcales bacterium]|nr:hypothetical protein [Myxococcales bacterium]
MAWRWLQRLWRPYRPIEELGALVGGRDPRVEIEGRVEPVGHLVDPLTGEACIAIEYRAWPPATTLGLDGASAHAGRAYQVNARQAVEFMLVDAGARVLVRPDPGEDVVGLHERLLERYGVGLRAETEAVLAGQRLRVAGQVVHRSQGTGTPHRELPYGAIIRAERIRVL